MLKQTGRFHVKKVYRYFLCFVIFSAILTGTVIAAEKVWVASRGAELKSDASASSSTLQSLDIGSELSVQSKQGRWYKVTTSGGRSGYIYSGKVSGSAPSSKSGGLFGSMNQSNIQASKADTARSMRGLSPEAQEYAQSTATPVQVQRALDNVLAMQTTDMEVERFLKDGHIGEYGK